ncbi:MAG: hypothetical protein E6425_03215 [Peptoniphilus harei]|nr:hypothetical protein [Peptoniphilus harei]
MSIRPYEKNYLRDARFDDFYDMIDSFFNDDFTPQRAMDLLLLRLMLLTKIRTIKLKLNFLDFLKMKLM